ncbi:MAG: FliI/YscN family ATPase [Nitrospinae bacterium]|nr:FliI/YscN family ATPase [Nitrospinota bacterium]
MENSAPAQDGFSGLARYKKVIKDTQAYVLAGKVLKIVGLTMEGDGPPLQVGHQCSIYSPGKKEPFNAEAVGFRENRLLVMPFGDLKGVSPGSRIVAREKEARINVHPAMLGRVLDGLGRPMDGKGPIPRGESYSLYNEPPDPFKKRRITDSLDIGIRAINGLLTLGKGQRVGIMAGSGVGKSVLLGMMARNTAADVNVLALIGERGREVREFIEESLGEEGLKRSVVVVATSDQPALVRLRGAYTATTIAEFFRARGKDVLFMMDSITRFALAQREIGLAVGEPPTTRGFTPSTFALLPKLLERAGTDEGKGSITGLYAVLVEGDDFNEPIADAVRSILDGHILLSRALAAHNHYPAIDVLGSVSRVMEDVASAKQKGMANQLLDIMAAYKEAEDLINIGAYVKGSSPKIDKAISVLEKFNAFLRQGIKEKVNFNTTLEQMEKIL